MQKVVGSSPIIRALRNSLERQVFSCPWGRRPTTSTPPSAGAFATRDELGFLERLLETLTAEASLVNKKSRCTCG
jgi:hypothetical protein